MFWSNVLMEVNIMYGLHVHMKASNIALRVLAALVSAFLSVIC